MATVACSRAVRAIFQRQNIFIAKQKKNKSRDAPCVRPYARCITGFGRTPMIKQLKHADIRPPDHPRVITDRRRSPYHQTSDCRRLLTHFNAQLNVYSQYTSTQKCEEMLHVMYVSQIATI